MRKTLAAILLLPALALAQTSFQTIGYQGLLKKSDGTPETQTVQVTFRIFAAATGGTELWSEVQNVTPNSGGFYAVFLGSQTAFPSTLFDGSDRYLELQIQGDSTALTPRQQIGSVPYALTAKNVNGGTSSSVTTGTINANSASISGKATSAATENSDSATTLATKGYVDGKFPITSNSSNIQFTGGNPSSSTGFSNTLTPSNIVKAWGYLTMGASGACVVSNGFNVSSCSYSGSTITVNFTTALSAANAGALSGSVEAPHGYAFSGRIHTASMAILNGQWGGALRTWDSGDHVTFMVVGLQ